MQRHLIHLFSVVLAAATSSSIVAQEESVYIAVDPCRIVNTTKGLAQPVPKNRHTNFRVSGTAGELADQGGNQSGGCAAPQGREGEIPIAIAAYVIAVPAPGPKAGGVLTAYPSDKASPPPGTGSTVNFDAGQTIGNTTIISLCQTENCPADGEFAILARNTAEHVIVDVQGYFYPPSSLPGYQVLQAPFAAANRTSVVAEVRCPSGTRVLSGGGSLGNSDWVLDGSYPRTDGQGWRVSYKSAGNTFSVAGQVWAVCANGS